MATDAVFGALKKLRPEQFQNPGAMKASILIAFDRFLVRLGLPAQILSEYRPGADGQHGKGRAIDFIVPNADPLFIWQMIKSAGVFTGIGIYLNDKDYVSFHVDTRTDRTTSDPAEWGNFVMHPADGAGRETRVDNYVASGPIVAMIQKKEAIGAMFVAAIGLMLHQLTKK